MHDHNINLNVTNNINKKKKWFKNNVHQKISRSNILGGPITLMSRDD